MRISAAICFLFIANFNLLYSADLPRPANSRIADFAGVMDSESYRQANLITRELERETGAEIAVVTVKSLGDESIDNFSVRLFQKWGIGKKGKDNGVLLVAAIEDRKTKIEVGYGLEGILPDGLCGEILDNYAIPYFKQGDYGRGLAATVSAVASVIAKDSGVVLTGIADISRPARKTSFPGLVLRFIFFIVMLFIFIRHPFLFLLALGMSGGGRSGGGFGGGLSGGGGAGRSW